MISLPPRSRVMKKTLQHLATTAVVAGALFASAPANAVFVARICNDLQCLGGDDFIIQDNAAGDTIASTGAISFSVSAFGYSLLVNTAQSKPMVGSAGAPQLDLTFSATTNGAAGNVFLYASDTNFTLGSGTFVLNLGGTSNTEFQFSGANLLASIGPLTTASFSGKATGPFAAASNPYSLTMGVTI